MTSANQAGSTRINRLSWTDGGASADQDDVVEECPVAMVYNGVSHVVMMATPADLEDFALGFSVTEGIVGGPQELRDIEVLRREQGIELQMTIASGAFAALKQRRRNMTGRTGCGLCGAESLDQAIPEPHPVSAQLSIDHKALARAAAALDGQQPLKNLTGAVHAAAFCDPSGEVLLLREDVGRHNALDKLIGALQASAPGDGFVLVTSRASYEMVAKTARANIALLAAVSAPTSLAIAQAEAAGLTLVGHVSGERQVVYTMPGRIRGARP